LGSDAHQVSDEPLRRFIPAPTYLRAEHEQPLRASGACATRQPAAAPSCSAVPGCGWPVRVSGDTRVASQHKAPPIGDAPYVNHQAKTASVIRRNARSSGVGEPLLRDYLAICPNGFVRDSHPSAFDDPCSPSQEPSARAGHGQTKHDRRRRRRAHRIRERGRTDLNGAGVGGADGGAAQRKLHLPRLRGQCGGWLGRDGGQPGTRVRPSLRAQERAGAGKCKLRVRDTLCCQPCGQSPRPRQSPLVGGLHQHWLCRTGDRLQRTARLQRLVAPTSATQTRRCTPPHRQADSGNRKQTLGMPKPSCIQRHAALPQLCGLCIELR